MSIKRDGKARRGAARRRGFSIESLEPRSLLTASSETFVGPSLSGLIAQAEHGKNTAPAGINRMLNALESQLQAGPLTDLSAGTVDPNGFITEAQGLEASFEQNVDKQLSPKFPNVDQLLKLQGERVVAGLIASNQEDSVGLISDSNRNSSFQTTINSLTDGPIYPLGTTQGALVSTTKNFKSELNRLEQGLSAGTLTIGQVNTTLGAEAEAYRTAIHAGIQVTQLKISGETDDAINALESIVNALAQSNSSDAQSQLTTAITDFNNKVLDTTGLFGPQGAYSRAPKNVVQRPGTTNGQAASTLASVSGASTIGGTATLTATLTSANGSPIAGQFVSFTLDGAFAGVALTNFVGVATLNGVAATQNLGTDTSGVVARFASNTNFLSSRLTGDLVVSQAVTALTNVGGTAGFGGTATLTANLMTSATDQPITGETVTFTLNGASVGTAVTDSNGLATLTGVATTDSVGTNSGSVAASYAGDATNAPTTATGDLVVTQAGTTLSNVAGTAAIGGTATLTANLISSVTNQPITGETVTFTLDGVLAGTAVTDSNGLATLTGVATTDGGGTNSGAVVASFAGDTNYLAAANATGDLVVSKTATTLGNVAGTATFGGPATLTANLTNTATSAVISGETVTFALDGNIVGNTVTDSNGLATLAGIATTDNAGTDTQGVVASFAGDSTYEAATNTTGDLVISPAPTKFTNVSGTAPSGGTTTLTATLTSSVTNQAVTGQPVVFTLDGTSLGTVYTDGSGIATLAGAAVQTGEAGAIGVSFAGVTNFASSTGTGNLMTNSPG